MDKLSEFKLYLIRGGMSPATVTKNMGCMQRLLRCFPDLKKENLDQYYLEHLE